MKGTIKLYNTRKGYGFITGEDGKEVYVNRTAIPTNISLDEGDEVQFKVESSEQGPQAKNLKKL
jgi:CspA family cold shock protein